MESESNESRLSVRPLDASEEQMLKRLWDEGIKSGPGRTRSIADIKRDARRRLSESKK